MSTKTTRIIDLNLFSGSSEALRQAAGGYYGDIGETGDISFSTSNISEIGGVESSEHTDADTTTNSVVARVKYANRLYVDKAFGFLSDEDWKTFIIGGTYADKTYSGLYNDAVYSDHANTSSLPYVPREIINIGTLEPSLTLTTEYYNHYPRFQAEVSNLGSELEAPNFYLLDSSSYLTPNYNTEIIQSRYQYSNLQNFLTNSYVNSEKTLDSTLENIFVLDPNLLEENNDVRMDTSDLNSSFIDGDLTSLYSLMPFGNKLEIKQDLANTEQSFRDSIGDDYSLKFVKILKEVFQGESRLQPSTANFAINTEAESSTGILTGSLETTTTIPVRLVDAPTMLLYAYRNPSPETTNISVFNSSSYEDQINYAMDTSGLYRYENTSDSLSTLNKFIENANTRFESTTQTDSLQQFLDAAGEPKYHETLAFRIEKIGGAPTGDARTENTIQNIWFYNTNSAITYLDTQVKYNTEYTYKVYKYDIVQGYKYQLSDVVTTRQIAVTDSGGSEVYCLEFYDPYTGESSPPRIIGDSLRENYILLLQEMNDFLNILETPAGALDSIPRNAASFFEDFLDGNYSTALFPQLANKFDTSRASYSGTGGLNDTYGSVFTTLTSTGYSIIATRIVFAKEAILNLQQNVINKNFQALEDVYRLYFSDFLSLTENYISGTLPRLNLLLDILGEHKDDFLNYYNSTTSLIDFLTILGVARGEMARYSNMVANLRLFFAKAFSTGIEVVTEDEIARFYEAASLMSSAIANILSLFNTLDDNDEKIQEHIEEILRLFSIQNRLAGDAQINSSYPHLADFNVTIEPSLKIIEIPLEEKRMRIVDHPPNDFVVTPHHLLDQSNRLAFYCKYDTFSMKAVTYPPTLTARDELNRESYLTGNDFIDSSEQTQESVSRPRFLEVYRTTDKPTNYGSFSGTLRETIDLRQPNGDIVTDHLFVERVRENIVYYYAFRAVNENGVAGQMSPVFESELINDGGYTYGRFEQHLEEDLAQPKPKEPLSAVKKLLNIIPNIQHLQLDTSRASFADPSSTAIDNISIGSNVSDPLFSDDTNRYFKIRLTSKKTGRKLDINIGFKKEVRK